MCFKSILHRSDQEHVVFIMLIYAVLLGFQAQMSPALAAQAKIGGTDFFLTDNDFKGVEKSDCVDLGKDRKKRWLCGKEKIWLFEKNKINLTDLSGKYCNIHGNLILCINRESQINIYLRPSEQPNKQFFIFVNKLNHCEIPDGHSTFVICAEEKLYGHNEWHWLVDMQRQIESIKKNIDQKIKENSSRDAQSDTAIR